MRSVFAVFFVLIASASLAAITVCAPDEMCDKRLCVTCEAPKGAEDVTCEVSEDTKPTCNCTWRIGNSIYNLARGAECTKHSGPKGPKIDITVCASECSEACVTCESPRPSGKQDCAGRTGTNWAVCMCTSNTRHNFYWEHREVGCIAPEGTKIET